MIDLTLIGIGTGNPEHVTLEAVKAMNSVDLILIPLKGEDKADLAGLKIRAPSRTMTDGLNALGATAVGMPVPEVPQALTTGVIDGAVIPWEVFGSLRIESVTRDHTEFGMENGGLSTSVMALVMNRAKYDALPDDLKALLTKSVDDLAGTLNEALTKNDIAAVEQAKAEGVTIHDWSAEERKKFRSIARSKWEAVAERSPNAKRVYDSVTAYLTEKGLLD